MAHSNPRSTGRHLDRRIAAVEQTLVTLATKEDLPSTDAAVARLPTREEMHSAIDSAIADVYRAIREEGERTRRHFDVVAEDLRGDTRLLAEGQVAL
jgi:hypothetical protein